MSCPSEDQIAAWLEDESEGGPPQERLEHHLRGCARCAALLSALRGTAPEHQDTRDGPAVDAMAATDRPPAGPGARGEPGDPEDDGPEPPLRLEELQQVRLLGKGGMGRVYLYEDQNLRRPVAVKFLRRLDARRLDLFRREALAVARLGHPNLVTVYRASALGDVPYLVSEYVAGTPLHELRLPLAPAAVLLLARQLAAALAHAHQRGVLHRDIKPANVIRAEDGTIKLVDFGLAKLLDQPPRAAEEAAATDDPPPRESTIGTVGTPLYMAPEQWCGQGLSERTDLYGLGALLYHVACGEPPHRADTLAALRMQVLDHEARPLRERGVALPPFLAAAIERCLRRDPAQRPASAEALLALLEPPRRSLRALLMGIGAVLAIAAAVAAWRHLRAPWPAEVRLEGAFLMGSRPDELQRDLALCMADNPRCHAAVYEQEQPARQVTLSPYFIDTVEVTRGRFFRWLLGQRGLTREGDALLLDGVKMMGLKPTAGLAPQLIEEGGRLRVPPGTEQRAVSNVSWAAAQAFCRAAGRRLPTEAEWEFAARGPERRRFPFVGERPECGGVVFGRRPGRGCGALGLPLGPQPVGTASQDVTPEGVRDLAGNVSEWVADRYERRYPPCPAPCMDPRPLATVQDLHVYRGGNYAELAAELRGATRAHAPPDAVYDTIGFRCARDAGR